MQVKQEKPTQNIPQQVEEKNDKQVDNAEVRKDELDGQIVNVKGRSDEKVQINIFKNHNKTKKTLRIRRNISFQDFKKKINPSFTSKYFMIQIQWKKQGQFLSIDNEREFDQVMRDYKFQKINIKTLDEPYVEPARRKEVEEAKRKQTILDTKKNFADQLNSSIVKSSNEFQKIFPHVPPQKIQKFFTEMVTNAQKWMRNDLIYKYQPLKQKQQKLTLQKQCSECKSRFFGPYYVCLKCPLQYILCTECQFKYGFQELITHTNVNHTFAKIIDHKFTIKSVSIKTEDEEKPQGEFYPSFNNNPKKYQYKIQKKPESLEERLNPKRTIQEIDKTFRKEHEG